MVKKSHYMLKLSKKAEYGIISVRYMARKPSEFVSAGEIANNLGLSFDFISKTLQALLRGGVLESQKGAKGGYRLSRKPSLISLADIINSLDESIMLVDCMTDDDNGCYHEENCTIKEPLHLLQKKIENLFKQTTLHEISDYQNNFTEFNVAYKNKS